MHCPKCASSNVEVYRDRPSVFASANKLGDRIFHCGVCGLILYGGAADKVVEAQVKANPPKPSIPAAAPTPTTLARCVPVTAQDRERAAFLHKEAEQLRDKARALRARATSNDVHDRAVNLVVVDMGRVLDLTQQVSRSRSVEEKRQTFERIQALLSGARERVRSLAALPEPVPVAPVLQPNKCALEGCTNLSAANSSYCSVNCRNQLARQRYKARQNGGVEPETVRTLRSQHAIHAGSARPIDSLTEKIRLLRSSHAVPVEVHAAHSTG